MNIIEPEFCQERDLLQDLASNLHGRVFRAGDGACCEGRLVTLHAYPATPSGEKPLIEKLVERALTPVDEAVPFALGRMDLALEILANAGSPTPPLARIAARSALLHLMDDPEATSSDKEDAAKALTLLNLPRPSRRMLACVKLMVGISQETDSKRVETVTLDGYGFASVPDVAPDAQCWLRPRHGPILALEIAERSRSGVLIPGTALKISSALNDWTLQFIPVGAGDVRMVLQTDEVLGFHGSGLAVVAAFEEGGMDRYVAELNDRGEGTFSSLPAGKYSLRIAMVPQNAASPEGTGFSIGQSRFEFRTTDPALQNTRCVCVQRKAACKTVFVGEAPVAGEVGPGGWSGRADGRLGLVAGPAHPRIPEQTVAVRGGVVQPRGGSPAAVPTQGTRSGELVCLLLL